jgi:zinc protease
MTSSVLTVQLDNGLIIHLKEIHTAPLISHWAWYGVGSRDEVAGLTGVSHWVEHMQFKGTDRFPSGVLDKAISRDGGMWNAFTYLDWTAYFETMPADKIDLAIELEADRMLHSRFNADEVESERMVVISEREGAENEPLFRLGEAVSQASFTQHPYRNEIIGSKADLMHIQRDDLYKHYRSRYTPSNAIITMAGDFESGEMLERLRRNYQHLPTQTRPDRYVPYEEPLGEEKRVEVTGPGETTYIHITYRSPQASHADFFAFSLLDSLLSGPSSLSMFGGGGISNKTSRLYRALVESELAVSVSGGLPATLDPGLYEIHITVRPDRTPAEVLKVFDQEILQLQENRVHDVEIARAIKQARALFAYSSENITNQAFWLGFADMFDNYDWFLSYVTRLEQVNARKIEYIAQTYLPSNHRVVGMYLPDGNHTDEGGEEA